MTRMLVVSTVANAWVRADFMWEVVLSGWFGGLVVKESLIGGRRVSSKTVHHCLKEKFDGI